MPPYRSSRRQRGYSIIEIAIVGAIMLILAGLALGSYVRYQRSIEADVVGSDLTAAIRETRARAMAERVTYRVTFTRGGGDQDRFSVARVPPLAPNAQPIVTQLPRGWRFSNTPGAPTTILGLADSPAGNFILDFRGDGAIETVPVGGAPINVQRTPFNGVIFLQQDPPNAVTPTARLRGRAITVFGLTGRTRLWKLLPRLNAPNQTDWVSGTQSVTQ
jgi:type II secretory pathway pseudopilin PulG